MNTPMPSVNKHLPEGVSYQEYWDRKYQQINFDVANEIIDRVTDKVLETNGATYLEFLDRDVARAWIKDNTVYPEGEEKGRAKVLQKSIIEANKKKLVEKYGWKFDKDGKPIVN